MAATYRGLAVLLVAVIVACQPAQLLPNIDIPQDPALHLRAWNGIGLVRVYIGGVVIAGSCFPVAFWRGDTVLATAGHVVSGLKDPPMGVVCFPEGDGFETRPIKKVVRHPSRDIALLLVPGEYPWVWGFYQEELKGDRVLAWAGYTGKKSDFYAFTGRFMGKDGDKDLWARGGIKKGLSGGPVIDMVSGRVAGLVTKGLFMMGEEEGVAVYFEPAGEIEKLLLSEWN